MEQGGEAMTGDPKQLVSVTKQLSYLLEDKNKIDIVCFGTPRILGDSIGPLIGTMIEHLQSNKVNIVGTLDRPIISTNFHERIKEIRQDSFVIAIDAALLKSFDREPRIVISKGGLMPGAAVTTGKPEIGDIHIKCMMAKSVHELITIDHEKVHYFAAVITTALRIILSG